MLITEEYRRQNAEMHAAMPQYGMWGARLAPLVIEMMARSGSRTVLDYGAGKGTLGRAMPDHLVVNYDPATYPGEPEPADFVACLDVLEHIEPDLLTEVLSHIRSKMIRGGLFTIAMFPAKKVLPDGRNAHLILKPAEWWLSVLNLHFSVIEALPPIEPRELLLYLEP